MKQATPSPFAGQKSFSVRPIQYVDLVVDGRPEPKHRSRLDPESVRAWEEDLKAIKTLFVGTLIAKAAGYGISVTTEEGSAPFAIQPTVSRIETGYYRIPAFNAVTVIELTFQILGSDGTVLDEVFVINKFPWDITNPSTGGRLRKVAEFHGISVASYLSSRTSSGP